VTAVTPPHALNGERRELDDPRAGRISYYVAGPDASAPSDGPTTRVPILLVHSINASASAHEVRPLFETFRHRRPTYALDLPGYGHSERSDRTYRQQLMVEGLQAMIARMRSDHDCSAVDALAVSISCEFLAKAALAEPTTLRSLGLISPTGFAKNASTKGPPDADCGLPAVLRVLNVLWIGQPLFRLLRSPASIRFFLRKTWGRKEIDEEFFRVSCRMARCPGAHHAPFHFLSGFLFGADMPTVYSRLTQPVWLVHGTRGDFTDYRKADRVSDKDNWTVTVLPTGALPYFEMPEIFVERYDEFMERVDAGRPVGRT
jgi:pimeloyl-ACP methyl ester carboxylesterase